MTAEKADRENPNRREAASRKGKRRYISWPILLATM
jgi:hypothetical protein